MTSDVPGNFPFESSCWSTKQCGSKCVIQTPKEGWAAPPSRLLVVKGPWAQQIVSGVKSWELRSSNTSIRERVGIALSGTQRIIGEASLVDCFPLTTEMINENFQHHRVESVTEIIPGSAVRAWVFRNPCQYQSAKPYQHPLGAIKWVQVGPSVFDSDSVSCLKFCFTFLCLVFNRLLLLHVSLTCHSVDRENRFWLSSRPRRRSNHSTEK